MFRNIDPKIKTVAGVIFAITALLIAAFAIIALFSSYFSPAHEGNLWGAFLPMVLVMVSVWAYCCLLYGFGELIAQTRRNGELLKQLVDERVAQTPESGEDGSDAQ